MLGLKLVHLSKRGSRYAEIECCPNTMLPLDYHTHPWGIFVRYVNLKEQAVQEFWQRSDECHGLKTWYTCGSTDVLFTFSHNQSCDQKCMLGHTHLHKLPAFYDSLCTVVIEVFVLVTIWQIMRPWPCPMTLRIMTKSRSNWINWVRSGRVFTESCEMKCKSSLKTQPLIHMNNCIVIEMILRTHKSIRN